MQYTIREEYCTVSTVRPLNDPYGSIGSLSLLTPSLSEMSFFFQSFPNEMQYTIREEYSTESKAT